MNDQSNEIPPDDDSSQPTPDTPNTPDIPNGETGHFTQRIKHQQLSALVPESVASGVFASGALVLTGPHEFVIDFLQSVTRPHQVAARVVLAKSILPSVVRALKLNLENYTKRFGSPPQLPKPPANHKPPPIEEIYDQLKLPETVASGVYANTVMITHSPTEFCFDFITSFYPRSAVAARIYVTTPQVPRILQTLERSMAQYQQNVQEQIRKQQESQEPLDDKLDDENKNTDND